jgi:hypothetical protein
LPSNDGRIRSDLSPDAKTVMDKIRSPYLFHHSDKKGVSHG